MRVQCRRKESSRSLSHLRMSFLYHLLHLCFFIKIFQWRLRENVGTGNFFIVVKFRGLCKTTKIFVMIRRQIVIRIIIGPIFIHCWVILFQALNIYAFWSAFFLDFPTFSQIYILTLFSFLRFPVFFGTRRICFGESAAKCARPKRLLSNGDKLVYRCLVVQPRRKMSQTSANWSAHLADATLHQSSAAS